MSKIRENIPTLEGELDTPAEGDLRAYVIFTQLVADGPHIYAGWLDAPDAEMAIVLACEHYGQDQKCVGIWAVPKELVFGPHVGGDAAGRGTAGAGAYQVFTQAEAGVPARSTQRIEAASPDEARDVAQRETPDAERLHALWVVPVSEIVSTARDEMIWRTTDQTYRLARGYAKDVREKWEHIRERRALEEYEKDDLKETF